MPYEVFLAFRYLRSRHKRRLARVTAIAAMVGITMGVAALIVTFALSNGFRDEMREKILQGTAHMSVLRADGLPIAEYANLAAPATDRRRRQRFGDNVRRWPRARIERLGVCSHPRNRRRSRSNGTGATIDPVESNSQEGGNAPAAET